MDDNNPGGTVRMSPNLHSLRPETNLGAHEKFWPEAVDPSKPRETVDPGAVP